MAKPLSQDEIDVLLEVRNQMSDAEDYDLEALESIISSDSDQRVSTYNFKRPRLFSQDQMRVLNHVHESFARDLAVYLSAQLRTIVDIRLTAVDQVLYSEYVMSSAPPSALYVAEVEDLNQKIVFEIDPRLVVFTIEKLFGGPGVFMRKPREISKIEERVMGKVMQRAFREMEKAWKQIHDIHLREDAFETNAEFVQIIPGVEPALVSTFEVAVYEQRSFINICYPYLLLERILGRSAMKQWISNATSEVPREERVRYENALRSLDVTLRAELGRATLPVSEIMQLEVGDVILLSHRASDRVRVFVGDQEKFTAVAGRSGKKRALRILNIVDTPSDEDDNEFS
ncbi:MAG TPA: flagellar motor switch protein FliM, partial [Rhodothermales bacterium]